MQRCSGVRTMTKLTIAFVKGMIDAWSVESLTHTVPIMTAKPVRKVSC